MQTSRAKYFVTLLVLFTISRLLLINFLDVRFEYDWVFQMWHFIDIELLKNKLLESVYYFHYQPPIFNLFLGIIHKQNLISPKLIMQIFFYSLTFLMGVIMFCISKRAGNRDLVSYFLVILFFLFPETIIYENWPIYTWTSSFLLVFGFYCLDRYIKGKKDKHLHLFFLGQLVLILTRSAFHPIFYVTWFLYLLIILRESRLKVFKTFVIYFSVFILISLKNLYEFGFFGVGSGLGFSLYKIAPKVSQEQLDQKKINIDPIFKIVPVRSVTTYGLMDKEIPSRFENIEILSKEFKSTLGKFSEEFSVNLGHYHYLELAKRYQKSAINIIKSYPGEYVKRVFRGTIMFFKPTWDHGFGVTHNAQALQSLINVFTLHKVRLYIESLVIKSEKPWPLRSDIPYSSYIFIPVFYFLVFIILYRFKLLRLENIQFMFVLYTAVYLVLVSNLIELAENDRYRVMIDPLIYLSSIILLPRLFKRKNI